MGYIVLQDKIDDFYQSNCTKRSVARAEVGQFFLNGFFFSLIEQR